LTFRANNLTACKEFVYLIDGDQASSSRISQIKAFPRYLEPQPHQLSMTTLAIRSLQLLRMKLQMVMTVVAAAPTTPAGRFDPLLPALIIAGLVHLGWRISRKRSS
jgi:hypothetical protein